MNPSTNHHFLTILIATLSLISLTADAGEAPKLVVSEGELLLQKSHHRIARLTNTGGKIDGFDLSPSGYYAAAHKIIGETTDHDDTLPEDQQPKMPTYSLLIVDLRNEKIVREIKAPEELLHLGEWLAHDVYRFTTGSVLDVVESYDYDAPADQIWRMRFDHDTMDYKRGTPLP